MSFDLQVGDAPPPVSDVPGIDAAAPETPAAPAEELIALNETFGGDFTGFSSVEDAQRAALLVAQSYAQAGLAPPQQHSAPAVPAVPAAQAPPVVEEDYSDLDPKVAARLKQLDADLRQTRAQAQQFQDRLLHEQTMIQQQQNHEILNRALAAIDALEDPRYGVGGNRTFTQDIARENLLRTADRIVAGMKGAGKSVPTIEKLVRMAVLAETGKLPVPKKAGAPGRPGAPPAPLAGGTPGQSIPQVPRRKTGGEVDTYMGDKDFMDGARAIVNRNRR